MIILAKNWIKFLLNQIIWSYPFMVEIKWIKILDYIFDQQW